MLRQQDAASTLNQNLLQNYQLDNQAALGGLNSMSGLMEMAMSPYSYQWMPLTNYSNIVGAPTKVSESTSGSNSRGFDFGIF